MYQPSSSADQPASRVDGTSGIRKGRRSRTCSSRCCTRWESTPSTSATARGPWPISEDAQLLLAHEEHAVMTTNPVIQPKLGLGAIAAALVLTASTVSAQTAPKSDVTYTKDIAPIVQRSCQNCHRPDSIAPMSFMTYADVRPY